MLSFKKRETEKKQKKEKRKKKEEICLASHWLLWEIGLFDWLIWVSQINPKKQTKTKSKPNSKVPLERGNRGSCTERELALRRFASARVFRSWWIFFAILRLFRFALRRFSATERERGDKGRCASFSSMLNSTSRCGGKSSEKRLL
jgi:hypothetical protein